MSLAHPYFLLLLLALPLLAAVYLFSRHRSRKALAALGDAGPLDRISSASVRRRALKAGLALAGLFFVCLALAGPRFGTKLVEMQQQGADVVIAVDVSKSMLAEDIKPNRMAKAKETLSTLLSQLGGNRVGIVAFAGTAFWQCPLTLDLSSANLFLQVMDANLIPLGGTSLGDALRLARAGLSKTAPRSKAIVLLTDGEDHDSDPLGAAQEAAQDGIKVYTIGFGSAGGEPIPEKDAQGAFTGYKKDKKGAVVMSRLDEALLSKIASGTGGEYFSSPDGTVDLGRLAADIRGLEKKRLSSRLNREHEERYQYFLFLGLALLLAEFFIPETKRRAGENA